MKVWIILVVCATVGIIFLQYKRNKNLRKFFIALVTFGIVILLAISGNLTRHVMPIYLAHIMLTVVSWGGLIFYLVRDRYYAWIIFSPLVTIGVFLLLEFLTGSAHEAG